MGDVNTIINTILKALTGFCSNIDKGGSKTEEDRFRQLLNSTEKFAVLHFSIQDAPSGDTATVADTPGQVRVRVLDDLITTEPGNSKELGRAQVMINSSGMGKEALTMNLNFYFTSGEFSGSSLCVAGCIAGRNPTNDTNSDLAIVGGTGMFRFARGYCITNTHTNDANANNGGLEYTLYVAYVNQSDVIKAT